MAAIDFNKKKASFSQYSNQVKISVSGVSIKSTLLCNAHASFSRTLIACETHLSKNCYIKKKVSFASI